MLRRRSGRQSHRHGRRPRLGHRRRRKSRSSFDQGRARSAQSATAPRAPLVTWNLQRDIGMTCGGEVTFLFECHSSSAWTDRRIWRGPRLASGRATASHSRLSSALFRHARGLDRKTPAVTEAASSRGRRSRLASHGARHPDLHRLDDSRSRSRRSRSRGSLQTIPGRALRRSHRQRRQGDQDPQGTRRTRRLRELIARFAVRSAFLSAAMTPLRSRVSVAAHLIFRFATELSKSRFQAPPETGWIATADARSRIPEARGRPRIFRTPAQMFSMHRARASRPSARADDQEAHAHHERIRNQGCSKSRSAHEAETSPHDHLPPRPCQSASTRAT